MMEAELTILEAVRTQGVYYQVVSMSLTHGHHSLMFPAIIFRWSGVALCVFSLAVAALSSFCLASWIRFLLRVVAMSIQSSQLHLMENHAS